MVMAVSGAFVVSLVVGEAEVVAAAVDLAVVVALPVVLTVVAFVAAGGVTLADVAQAVKASAAISRVIMGNRRMARACNVGACAAFSMMFLLLMLSWMRAVAHEVAGVSLPFY